MVEVEKVIEIKKIKEYEKLPTVRDLNEEEKVDLLNDLLLEVSRLNGIDIKVDGINAVVEFCAEKYKIFI